ncbi:hypothetical protein C8R41DRAFT_845122 [Lentinula lateritia]|uniref:Uncharacterized protein n=1 Tax=Lentinula lateritia TaxID=40482 RepID=A0ABQ8V6P4_9AGAR|nr:hypothetical protein C8R41DRAFT_845122 [Lentinula lateritia]
MVFSAQHKLRWIRRRIPHKSNPTHLLNRSFALFKVALIIVVPEYPDVPFHRQKTCNMIFLMSYHSWCSLTILVSMLLVGPSFASPLAHQSPATDITRRHLEARNGTYFNAIPVFVQRTLNGAKVRLGQKRVDPREAWAFYISDGQQGLVGHIDWESDPHAPNWPWVVSLTAKRLHAGTKSLFYVDLGNQEQLVSVIQYLKDGLPFQGNFGFVDAAFKYLFTYLGEHQREVPSIPESLESALKKLLDMEAAEEHVKVAEWVAKYKESYLQQWDQKPSHS